MKKLLFVLSCITAFTVQAQCTISGSSTLKTNETATFTLENDNAQ